MCDHVARSTAFISYLSTNPVCCVLVAGMAVTIQPISGVVTVSGVRTETPSVSVTTAQPSPAQHHTHRAKVETKEKQVPSPAQPRLAASAVLEWRSTKKPGV